MSVVVDLHELNDLARALRTVAPEITKALHSELKSTVEQNVTQRARMKWAENSSQRSTIQTRRSGLTVSVTAGRGENHPGQSHAFEHNGDAGTFRHPVYGNRDVWVDQEAHPFLGPSLIAGGNAVMTDVANAVERAIDAALRV